MGPNVYRTASLSIIVKNAFDIAPAINSISPSTFTVDENSGANTVLAGNLKWTDVEMNYLSNTPAGLNKNDVVRNVLQVIYIQTNLLWLRQTFSIHLC